MSSREPFWLSEEGIHLRLEGLANDLGWRCFDEETEILTIDGFKGHKEVSVNDEIATLSKDGYLEYQKPKEIFRKQYEGEMVKVEHSKTIDQMVTPNHRLYVSKPVCWKDGKQVSPRAGKFEIVYAEDSIGKFLFFKKNAMWKGEEVKYFVVPSTERLHEYKILMDDWLAFLGLYISEGSSLQGRVLISQKKGNKREIMKKKLLEIFGDKVTENDSEILIHDTRLVQYLEKLGKSYEKYIPKEFKLLCSRQLEILYNFMMLGDGNEHGTYYTSSAKLVDDVQEILLKIGLSGTLHNTKNRVGRKIFKKYIQKRKAYEIGKVNYNECAIGHHKNKGSKIVKVDYSGIVWCPNTPNGIVYIRRKGKTCWSGNTYNGALRMSYEEAGFKELVWVTNVQFPIGLHRKGSTCELCFSRSGKRYRVGQFLPRIPAHLNCKCYWDVLIEG